MKQFMQKLFRLKEEFKDYDIKFIINPLTKEHVDVIYKDKHALIGVKINQEYINIVEEIKHCFSI